MYTIIIRMFCPRAGLSLQTQVPRPQFCTKAGFPLQIQEPRLQFTNDEQLRQLPVAFRTPLSLKHFNKPWKIRKEPRGTSLEVRRVDLVTGPSGLQRNSPQELNISSNWVFDQIRDPEIQSPFAPLKSTRNFKEKETRPRFLILVQNIIRYIYIYISNILS